MNKFIKQSSNILNYESNQEVVIFTKYIISDKNTNKIPIYNMFSSSRMNNVMAMR